MRVNKLVQYNIWAELQKAELVTNPDANRFRGLTILEQMQLLKSFDIYAIGYNENDNFEQILKSKHPKLKLPKYLGESKVIRGRWWAQHAKCPQVIRDVFEVFRNK